ncbi:hypothetical protein N7475_006016 [Penicillium sp. IBT 31633x]|nr:hypothetical protein N7475_006016 [Penicillium sp. IBT 31633x]
MPDIRIINDNASFASSDTFSTRDSRERPPPQLRRRSTVTQLTRKVSKRISQTILRAGVQEHKLSERNLRDLNNATYVDSHSPRSPERRFHGVNLHDPICENIEEECPPVDVEAMREMRLQESYVAFCQNFTLSGTSRMSRRFDLSMGMGTAEECVQPSPSDTTPEKNDTSAFSGSRTYPENITVDARPRPNPVAFPIPCASTVLDNTPTSQSITAEKPISKWPDPDTPKIEEDFRGMTSSFEITRNSNYPQPPPRIITPAVWMDMRREERERKAARRQTLLNPFRSWFMTSQSSWGRRYNVVE